MPDLEYVQDEIDRLRANLKTNSHWFTGWRAERIQKEAAFFAVQVTKLETYVQLKHVLETTQKRLDHQKQLEEKTFESQIAIAQALVDKEVGLKRLQECALDMGLTLEGFMALRALEETQRVQREHESRMVDIRLLEADRKGEIDNRHYGDRKEIDFQYDCKKVELEIRGALAYQHLMNEQALQLLSKLNNLVAERHKILFSGQPIMLVELQTANMTMVIDAWREKLARYLQDNNGQGESGCVSDSEHRGLPRLDVEEGKE